MSGLVANQSGEAKIQAVGIRTTVSIVKVNRQLELLAETGVFALDEPLFDWRSL